MAHTLIAGTTGSYKTHLAAALARALVDLGELVIVYTPVRTETRWHGAGVVHVLYERADFLAFMAKVKRRAFIFFDEAMVTIGHYDIEMARFATESRNAGHSCFFICQFAKQFNKGVRRQCERIYCFHQEEDDAKELKKQFSEPLLLRAPDFRPGFYVHKRRFQNATFKRIRA